MISPKKTLRTQARSVLRWDKKKGEVRIVLLAVLVVVIFVAAAVALLFVGFQFGKKTTEITSTEKTTSEFQFEKEAKEKVASNETKAPILNVENSRQEKEVALEESYSSQFWYLNSGGIMYLDEKDQPVRTSWGAISSFRWADEYKKTNPKESDSGIHPQNIFRVYTLKTFGNYEQKLYFKVHDNNLSDPNNRHAYNGVSLVHYKDQNNMYLFRIRMDGRAEITKKVNGNWLEYPLVAKRIFDRNVGIGQDYNSIPSDIWIGIKSQVESTRNGVKLKFYVDPGDGVWQVLESQDRDLPVKGQGGIWSDFMDLSFRDYSIR